MPGYAYDRHIALVCAHLCQFIRAKRSPSAGVMHLHTLSQCKPALIARRVTNLHRVSEKSIGMPAGCCNFSTITSTIALRFRRQNIVSVESNEPFSKYLFTGAPPPHKL